MYMYRSTRLTRLTRTCDLRHFSFRDDIDDSLYIKLEMRVYRAKRVGTVFEERMVVQ